MAPKLHIILGCFGRADDNFVSCNAITNSILEIDLLDKSNANLLDYLDNLELFDKRMLNYNAIRHVIFYLQDNFEKPNQRLWSEKMFTLYQKFTLDHRDCGLFIDLKVE